jgi:Xaa-Pro aminopeptidase
MSSQSERYHYPERLEAVRQAMQASGLEAALIGQAENRRYLSGFTGSAGRLIITAQDACIAVDPRYYEQATLEAPDYELYEVGHQANARAVERLTKLGITRAGFEAESVTYSEAEELREKGPGIEWVPVKAMVETLRAVKSSDEIEAIRAAVHLADQTVQHLYDTIRAGMTEQQVAWQAEVFTREHGATGVAFPFIIAGGKNAALPHASPSADPIEPGQPVVVDLGARINGYVSDITRTFSLGRPQDPEYEKVYNIVLRAQEAAIQGARPGMTGVEIDRLARQVIEEAGYGEQFGHGLGHGVGLAVHEMPRLGPAAQDTPIEAGAVVTFEPGIYIAGRFGVRIEDIGVITEGGVEVLTNASKPPVVSRG